MIPFSANIGSTNYLHNAVECISAASQNKERAMMLLEMLNTDPYVVTTLPFVVDGEHNNVGADGILDFTGTTKRSLPEPARPRLLVRCAVRLLREGRNPRRLSRLFL